MLQNVAEEVEVLEQTFPVRYTIAPRWKKWPFKENRPSTCGCWSVAQARCNDCNALLYVTLLTWLLFLSEQHAATHLCS